MTTKPKIGFIGVGLIGHGMAKNILTRGYDLMVKGNRNRTPVDSLVGMGAVEAASPKEMGEACDIVFICLSNSPQVEAVVRGPEGLIASGNRGLIVVDTTTANPVSTEALAADLAAAGMHMVDAPLGRTPKEAEAGTLDAMVGHRSPRYLNFGWASARLDDVANWVPARLTGALFAALGELELEGFVQRRPGGVFALRARR